MDSPSDRPLTATTRALVLAERALELCECGRTESKAALSAVRAVLESGVRGEGWPRSPDGQ